MPAQGARGTGQVHLRPAWKWAVDRRPGPPTPPPPPLQVQVRASAQGSGSSGGAGGVSLQELVVQTSGGRVLRVGSGGGGGGSSSGAGGRRGTGPVIDVEVL